MDLMTLLAVFYVFCWFILLELPAIIVFGIAGLFALFAKIDERIAKKPVQKQ